MHQWMWRTNGCGEAHTSFTALSAATTLSCASFAYSHALPHFRPACRLPARETTARMPPPSILLPLSAGSAQNIWPRAQKSRECIFPRCEHTCTTFDLSLRHPPLFMRHGTAPPPLHAPSTAPAPRAVPGQYYQVEPRSLRVPTAHSRRPDPDLLPALPDHSYRKPVYSHLTGLTTQVGVADTEPAHCRLSLAQDRDGALREPETGGPRAQHDTRTPALHAPIAPPGRWRPPPPRERFGGCDPVRNCKNRQQWTPTYPPKLKPDCR